MMASSLSPSILIGFLLQILCCPSTLLAMKGHLEEGVTHSDIQVKGLESYLAPYIHSSFNGTNVKLGVHCDSTDADFKYTVQYVIRSSPCDKEFYAAVGDPDGSETWLRTYFGDPRDGKVDIPFMPNDYDSVYFYKSGAKSLNCNDGTFYFNAQSAKMKPYPVRRPPSSNSVDVDPREEKETKEERKRENKREASVPTTPDHNSTTTSATESYSEIDENGAYKDKPPAIVLPADAIYLLIVEVVIKETTHQIHNVTVEVGWKNRFGTYLSAIDHPLLTFYGVMCGLYGLLAVGWLIVCCLNWKDLLRIQFWIGGVILLGMIEKATFYAEYQTLNATGKSVLGAIQTAEIISCLKRTLARILIIIVSVGFGVVKPRLGSTLHKVVGVGLVYFVLSSMEAINRVSQKHVEGAKQKQMAGLPLTLLEVGIFWWIFSSLLDTMRALRLRRNEVKLSLYRHFTNTLIFAVMASVAFMAWSLYMHTFTPCLKDWTELWVDIAFWHILFSVILVVIMILWRPTNNNQRYAFTPLLDDGTDDDDLDDTIFTDAYVTKDQLKARGIESTTKAAKRGGNRNEDESTLEDELKWVEENIPSGLADKALPALVDSEEEAEQTKFEISKMQ